MTNPIPLLVSLAAASAWAAPTVFAESPMVKVRPSLTSHADTGATLWAAKNEFVSFQVVVHGENTGATGVKATLSGLTGPGTATISGADLSLYREALLNITTPSTPDVQPGMWPDPLVPDVDEIAQEKRNAFPFDVPSGEARAIWVDIHVPAAAVAGAYTGTVTVTGTGLSATVPVSLNVIDVAMPSTSSLSSAFLIFAPNVCAAHTGSSSCNSPQQMTALLGRYEQMALEHRLTLTNVPQGNPNGDWGAFDAAWGPYLDGTAPSRLAGAKMTTAEYFGGRDATSYAAFAAHFKAKGWYDRAFDYTADEPPATPWATLVQRAAIARQGAPDLRTLTTTTIASAQANGALQDLDILVPNIDAMFPISGSDQHASYASFATQPQKKVWMYQSCDSHGCGDGVVAGNTSTSGWPDYVVDCSAARNRAMEWASFRAHVSGELYYETALMLPGAWSSVYGFHANGDGTLFYPGTPAQIGGNTDVPISSIRLKLIRMGMQDHQWLQLVTDAGDPQFADRVAASVFPGGGGQVSDDGSVLENARTQLVQRMVQLLPTAPGNTQPPPGTVVLPGDGTRTIVGVTTSSGSGPVGRPGTTSAPVPISGATVDTSVNGSGPKQGCSGAPSALIPLLPLALLILMRRRLPRLARAKAVRRLGRRS